MYDFRLLRFLQACNRSQTAKSLLFLCLIYILHALVHVVLVVSVQCELIYNYMENFLQRGHTKDLAMDKFIKISPKQPTIISKPKN
jgi:hypothetical protein